MEALISYTSGHHSLLNKSPIPTQLSSSNSSVSPKLKYPSIPTIVPPLPMSHSPNSSSNSFYQQASMYQHYLSAAAALAGSEMPHPHHEPYNPYNYQMMDFLKMFSSSSGSPNSTTLNVETQSFQSILPLSSSSTETGSKSSVNLSLSSSLSSLSSQSPPPPPPPQQAFSNGLSSIKSILPPPPSHLQPSLQPHPTTGTFEDSYSSNSFMNRLAS